MKYVRIYADEAGVSHFEDREIATNSTGVGGLTDARPATSVFFRHAAVGANHDWHTAPRRQFVIALRGAFEVVAGDGETRRFGPGDVLLADDTTGKGHITRTVGDVERLMVFVPLAE